MMRSHLGITHYRFLAVITVVWLAHAAAFGKKPKSSLPQGNKMYDQHKYAEAVEAYNRAEAESPKDPRVFFNRALANEMVKREDAVADWKKFLEAAGTDPDWKEQVQWVQDRVKALTSMPAPPDQLLPNRYVSAEDDYYDDVATQSVHSRWQRFPVRIYLSSPPQDWQGTIAKALDLWKSLFPLEVVDAQDTADIIVKWGKVDNPVESTGMTEQVEQQSVRGGDVLESRRCVIVTLDDVHRLYGGEMLSAALHFLGHALGIHGHSGRITDVMYPQAQHAYSELLGGEAADRQRHAPSGISARALTVTKVSQRDINTLVRLYNSPGPLALLD